MGQSFWTAGMHCSAIATTLLLLGLSINTSDGQSFGGSGNSVNNDPYARSAPAQIWDCYYDWALRDRFMRLPQSMDNLIGLIRKLENYPTSRSWDIEKMTAVLMKRFRHDGIFFRPPDNRNPSEMHQLYVGNRMEEEKLELLYELAPDRLASEFPEDALTSEEKCGLHFMLSYSLNDTQRPDERDRGASGGTSGVSGGRGKRSITDWIAGDDDTNGENEEDKDETANSELRDDAEVGLLQSRSSAPLQSLSQQMSSSASGRQVTQFDYARSSFPLEYGVVYTRYGTVAAGAVLAGISFGLQDRYMRVEDILPDNKDYTSWPVEMLNAQIMNYYAGTVGGDIAQSAVHNGGITTAPKIGPSGKWNDTVLPTEYSLDYDLSRVSFLTTAEILGGIDGLIMARKIKDWDENYVKLSHVLDMYYSQRGVSLGRSGTTTSQNEDGSSNSKKFRACDRFDLMKDENVVKRQEFEEQAKNFAYALYAKNNPIGTVQALDSVKKAVDVVMSEFWRFVENDGNGMKNDWDCPVAYTGSSSLNSKNNNLPVETRIDLHVMIDSDSTESDRYGAIYSISQALSNLQMDASGVNRVAVNMTQSDAWQCFLDLGEEQNKALVAHKLLRAERWGYASRFDLRAALQAIRNEYSQFTTREYMDNAGGTNAKVFLLIVPKNRPQQQGMEDWELEELFEEFHQDLPDIQLLVASRNADWRQYLTDDSNFISLNQYNLGEKLYERLKEIPARLTFPRCKDGSDYEAGNKYEGYYTPGTKQTLAYNAHYFFSSGTADLKIRFYQKLPIEVCSRRYTNSDEDVRCGKVTDTSDNSVVFEIRPRCGRECEPIILTMTMDPEVDASAYAPVCSDDRYCSFPDQVKFEITHEDMRCNSANAILTSIFWVLALTMASKFIGSIISG